MSKESRAYLKAHLPADLGFADRKLMEGIRPGEKKRRYFRRW